MIQSAKYERVKSRTWKLTEHDVKEAILDYILKQAGPVERKEITVEIAGEMDDMVMGEYIRAVAHWERREDAPEGRVP